MGGKHLLSCDQAIFSWNFEGHGSSCLWISKPFSGDKSSIYDDDMVAKMEFLQQHEDDLTREDIGKLWTDTSIKYEHPILSIKALSFIQFPLTYCSKVGFSSMVSIKTMYQTGLRLIMVL